MSGAVAVVALLTLPASAADFDDTAAVALARKGHCFKCHSVEKRKNAPSYKEIAVKYKTRPDAEEALVKHLTGNPMVKTEDGDEAHASFPTDDQAQMRNMVRWLLAR